LSVLERCGRSQPIRGCAHSTRQTFDPIRAYLNETVDSWLTRPDPSGAVVRETSTVSSNDSRPDVSQTDDLYSLPLDEFTGARDRLAGRLSIEGKADEAAAVARLRKPSVGAWALNRASRRHPENVRELLASHERIRSARSAEALQEASRERQRAVSELEAQAVAELAEAGRPASGPMRDRIAKTLLAVATDPEGEQDLAAGRLVRELEPSGEGWGAIAGWDPSPTPKPAVQTRTAADRARAQADKLRLEATRAEQRVEMAERALSEAEQRAQDARVRAAAAEAEAERAEKKARKESRS
jgi:hypothetical protein